MLTRRTKSLYQVYVMFDTLFLHNSELREEVELKLAAIKPS